MKRKNSVGFEKINLQNCITKFENLPKITVLLTKFCESYSKRINLDIFNKIVNSISVNQEKISKITDIVTFLHGNKIMKPQITEELEKGAATQRTNYAKFATDFLQNISIF